MDFQNSEAYFNPYTFFNMVTQTRLNSQTHGRVSIILLKTSADCNKKNP